MFKISNNKITIIQGDTAFIALKLDDYKLIDGDTVYFTVKKDFDSEITMQKIVTTFVDGVASIQLSKEDTKQDAGEYLYDIQCSLNDGRVDTVVPPSKFTIRGGITND